MILKLNKQQEIQVTIVIKIKKKCKVKTSKKSPGEHLQNITDIMKFISNWKEFQQCFKTSSLTVRGTIEHFCEIKLRKKCQSFKL